MLFKRGKTENKFLKANSLIQCVSCGKLISKISLNCVGCGKSIKNFQNLESKGMAFLNLTNSLMEKTRYWREVLLLYGIVKLPMEIIAYTELQSRIGIFQGIINILITIGLLTVASWLIIVKRIRMRMGEFVE